MLSLAGVVILLRTYFDVPGLLALLIVPTAWMMVSSDRLSALAFTVMESLMLLAFGFLYHGVIARVEVWNALGLVWVTLGLLYAIYVPIYRLVFWSWDHFRQGQELLETARDRQAELKDALDALAHANYQLMLMNERLAALRIIAEQAKKSKADFVANVSHEFRTPLNIIMGLAEILLDAEQVYGEPLPEEAQRDVEILFRNCQHLQSMVNDVLDLSQVEAGRMALSRQWVDLRNLLEGVNEIVRPLLEKKQLAFHITVSPDTPEVYCDPRRIRQVILNLVSNAVRFTDRGYVNVHVESTDNTVTVLVEDTGPGLSPEDAEHIFEPFRQGSEGSARGTGSGLGLSISKQFVEMHGGRMWLHSVLGKGSTFGFSLPISPPPEHQVRPDRWIQEGWSERRTRAAVSVPSLSRRLIVVDETKRLSKLFERYNDDLDVQAVPTLEEAARLMETLPAQAITLNAPTADALWARIQEAFHLVPDTPIIGFCLPAEEKPVGLTSRFQRLLKPISREDLQNVLGQITPFPRTVLVVDDDPDTLEVMGHILRAVAPQIKVMLASDGRQALGIMRASPPDLLLLDIIMPDFDGKQVLEVMMQEESLRAIPVVLISAQDPIDRPLISPLIVGASSQGVSLMKLLRGSRVLSALLMQPD
ncbi:MAG: hybrid sensor histidine kinase/response regulator [Chloroflexi bacterium]|nr:hybrid sensor histidine kinase/response regulator [Chloroflexota bacterium]